jgi:hypothetical protein
MKMSLNSILNVLNRNRVDSAFSIINNPQTNLENDCLYILGFFTINLMNKKNLMRGVAVLAVTTLLGTATIVVTPLNYAYAPSSRRGAPVVITGDNIYVAWWTNKTANNNEEVNFRVSTDGGQNFGDKINLSNTIDKDSTNVTIDADADSVVVTWWESNQTSETPVMRVSNDNGATFGPVLNLATNGTIGASEQEGEE